MREQLAAQPQSGSHPCSPVALLLTASMMKPPQCPQIVAHTQTSHYSIPMALLLALAFMARLPVPRRCRATAYLTY